MPLPHTQNRGIASPIPQKHTSGIDWDPLLSLGSDLANLDSGTSVV